MVQPPSFFQRTPSRVSSETRPWAFEISDEAPSCSTPAQSFSFSLLNGLNAGSREMSVGSIGFNDAGGERGLDTRQRASQARSRAAIERVFSPEFRNRLDAIVSFQPLTPDVMETIVDKFIIQLEEQLAERRIAIALHPRARRYLAAKGYDPIYGARPLARVIQTEVRDRLTDEILFGALENGGTVAIDYDGETLQFTFEAKLPQRNETVS